MTLEKLFILDRNEQVQAVLSNRGAACPFYDAVHKEQMNGENSLEFTVPTNSVDSQYVVEENLVLFKDLDLDYQLFVIKEMEDEHGGGLYKRVYCEHASSELLYFVVKDKRPTEQSASFMLGEVLSGTRWEVGTVEPQTLASATFYYQNVSACIADIVNLFGGEVRYRVEFLGSQVIGRYVDILEQRGDRRGKRFVYGKDVKGIRRTVDTTGLATAVIGRGKGVENEEGTGYGRKLSFKDVEWSVDNGDPVDKPLGQEWVGDPAARDKFGFPDGDGGYLHRTITVDFEDEDDPERLLEFSWDHLQTVKAPLVSYEMDVVDLEKAAGYEHESVRLGDTVIVIDRTFTPELRVEARVIEIERNLLRPEDNKVVLGSFVEPYKVDDKFREVEERVKDRTVPTSILDGVIDAIQNEIHSGNGTVRSTWEGFINYDKPPEQGPEKFIKMVDGKLMLGKIVGGEEEVGTFIDGNIVYADLIAAGTMLANRIKGGKMALGGDGVFGELFFYDSQERITMAFNGETGSVNRLKAGELTSPNVPTRSTPKQEAGTVHLYVNPNSGNDVNGNGSSSSPFRTIQRAVDEVPDICDADFHIHADESGEQLFFYEHLVIRGKDGDGSIRFTLGTSDFIGWVRISGADIKLLFNGGRWKHDGTSHPRNEGAPYSVFHIIRSDSVLMQNCTIVADKGYYGVAGSQSSYIEIRNGSIHRAQRSGAVAQRGAVVYLYDVQGKENGLDSSGEGYGAYARTGGTIVISGSDGSNPYCPEGVNGYANAGHTGQLNANSDGNFRTGSANPISAPNEELLSFQATDFESWRFGMLGKSYDGGTADDGYGWHQGFYQGSNYYPHLDEDGDLSADSWGASHVGFCWFGDNYSGSNSFSSLLDGRDIVEVRLRVRRNSRHGRDIPNELKVWTHQYSPTRNEPGDWDPTTDSAVDLTNGTVVGSYEYGEEKSFDLPHAFGDYLQNNPTSAGIAIFHEDYTQSFEVKDYTVTLEVIVA
ncbi:phage tail protein [Paludifilum halophilum]|uniref:Prophage tail endopeptidase domain-containing protein n=1 Tax=Paludifilum halophilum TaxID=1642702 RepID=A0A235B8G2_9BACL|nr:phage tail protein [Paludifilum halophilum]OYD08551.1 hypothetical protein CHM34_06915 [Paludifilum halophilum]